MAFLLLLLHIFTTLTVLEAQSPTIISLGSSLVISAASQNSQSTYWLSRSENFAFGFYPLSNPQQFLVGIWLPKCPEKTLVWVANRDDPPLPAGSSLHLTNDGILILKIAGSQEKQISDSSEPASFASLLDNGNFVLYNSRSQITWQSFDSPTDTIVAGQMLKNKHELFSRASKANYSGGMFRLKMQEDGNLVLYPRNTQDTKLNAYWTSDTYTQEGNSVTLNLDPTGRLYLVDSSGFSIKNITEGDFTGEHYVYRATLDADGNFRLYIHSFDETAESKPHIFWSANQDPCSVKGICGFNSYCTINDGEPSCVCLPGFEFDNPKLTWQGCNRRKNLLTGDNNCGNERDKYQNSTMVPLENSMWANRAYELLSVKAEEECRQACLEDCYCSAAVLINEGCLKYDLPLMYGRRGGDIRSKCFIKVATDSCIERERERERPRWGEWNRKTRDGKESNSKWFLIGLVLFIFSLVFLVASAGSLVLFFCEVRRDRSKSPHQAWNNSHINAGDSSALRA